MEKNQIIRDRRKHKKVIKKNILKKIQINNLDKNITLNITLKWKLIHVTSHNG